MTAIMVLNCGPQITGMFNDVSSMFPWNASTGEEEDTWFVTFTENLSLSYTMLNHMTDRSAMTVSRQTKYPKIYLLRARNLHQAMQRLQAHLLIIATHSLSS